MKRLILTLVLGSSLAVTLAQPQIVFDAKSHDFGTFEEETGPVTHLFKFVNTGNEPLVVTNVRTTCGCTASQYTREPVAPNYSGVIKVTYNPKGRPGRFSKPIYVTTNASIDRENLRITGVVIGSKSHRVTNPYHIGDLSLRSLHIPLFDVPKGHIKTGQLVVRNEGKTALIPSFRNIPSHIQAEMIPSVLHPDEEGILKIYYDPDAIDDWGFRRDEFTLGFDHDDQDAFNTITVSANLLDDFKSWSAEERQQAGHITLSSDVIDFGIIKGNKPQKQALTITNTGQSKLTIHKISNENRALKVKLKRRTVNPGKSAELTVEIDPSLARSNLLNCRVMIISNDPNQPSKPIRILGSFE